MAPTFDKDYVLKTVEERGVRFVRFWFTDVLGVLKSFAVTDTELEGAFEEGMGFDGSSIDGFTRLEESDMIAYPDASTFQLLPWRPSEEGVGRLFTSITKPDGSPFEGDPRNALRRVCQKAADILDFGCGPGQTTAYLYDQGIKNITGIDLSSDMVSRAKDLHPQIHFKTGDMSATGIESGSADGITAFYAIVNYPPDELSFVFNEFYRILKKAGTLFLCFHTSSGETELFHVEDFFNKKTSLDFYYFNTDSILDLLKTAGFSIKETIIRYPYVPDEFPTKRAYVFGVK